MLVVSPYSLQRERSQGVTSFTTSLVIDGFPGIIQKLEICSLGLEDTIRRCLIHLDPMDIYLSKLQEIVKDREAWHAAVHSVAVRHNLVTERQQFIQREVNTLSLDCSSLLLIVEQKKMSSVMWTAHEREDLFGIFLRRGETLRVRACEEWTV